MKISKKALDLLKSGDFTIAYHDNGYCCLYRGKLKYEELGGETEVAEFSDLTDGYCPDVVEALVKALGGKVESI